MKRIISLLVILTLLFSLYVPCVYAVDSETEISAVYDFALLSALEIDKGVNSDLDAFITRAEFIAMAVRCLNTQNTFSIDSSFTDVKEGDKFADEIYAAKALNMTNGTAPGIFSPDEGVGVNVALKIVINAMGYEAQAVAMGGYPAGYQTLERKLDLLTGCNINGNLTVFEAKTIITNALKAPVALFGGIKGDTIIYDNNKDRCLLTENFNLGVVSGVVIGADYLTLEDTVPDENCITISNYTFKSNIPTAEYFGMSVNAYYDNETKEVNAIEVDNNNRVVTVNAKDIIDYKNRGLVVYVNGSEKTYRTASSLSFMENGRLIDHTEADFKFDHGNIKLIDNNSDGMYDYALAEKVEYYVISAIDDVIKKIYDKHSPIGSISFDKYEIDYGKRCELVNLGGGQYDFEALKEDDVLCIMRSYDNKIIIARAGGSKILSGTLTAITPNGYEIDGIEYEANSYFKERKISLSVGSNYEFILAADATITTARAGGESSIKYGYLIGVSKKDSSLSAKTEIKLVDEMGNIRIFPLAKKLTLDGERNVAFDDAKLNNAITNGNYPKYQLLRYSTNNNGEVSLLDTYSDSVDTQWDIPENSDEKNSLKQYLSKTTVTYRSSINFGTPYFSFGRGVIFAVPKELKTAPDAYYSEELFTVYDSGSLANNHEYDADIFDLDENYYPQAITLYSESAVSDSGRVSGGADSHLVYEVTNGVDDEGNETVVLRTYSKGRYYRNYIQSVKLAGIKAEDNLPSKGDVIRMAFNKKGEITGILIDVKYDSSTKKGVVKYKSGSTLSSLSFASGSVKTYGEGLLTLKAETLPKNTTVINNVAPFVNGAEQYVVFNTSNGTVTKGMISDLVGENSGKPSNVVCRLSYYEITDIFIYVD